jgi:beta-phosphoglucomutase-like phosphatase (HAD superfamily)
MDRREYYYAREFLNLPRHGASAHVIAEVAEEKQGDEWWEEITLVIADCNRITSFDLTTEEHGRENTFHKLDRLISVLQGLREAIAQLTAERAKRGSKSKGTPNSVQ